MPSTAAPPAAASHLAGVEIRLPDDVATLIGREAALEARAGRERSGESAGNFDSGGGRAGGRIWVIT